MYKKSFCGRHGIGAVALLLSATAAHADISGTVFTDYNLNGQLDNTSKVRNLSDTMDINAAVDRGVVGAEVKAECVGSSGNLSFGPVTTNASGQFTLPTTGAVDGAVNCVLQLFKLPDGYSIATQADTGVNILTQFVSPNSNTAKFALQQTASYCQNNPNLATNRYAYGQQTPNPPFAGNNDVANVFAFPYNSGVKGVQGTTPAGLDQPTDLDAAKKNLALAKDVGSVFGLGWHPASKSLFSAAYMKAWTGFGSGGTGGIYRTNIADPANPTTTLYANLNAIFPATPPTAGDDPYLTGVFSVGDTGYVQISNGTAPKGDGTNYPDGSYVASGNATRDNQNGQISTAVGKTAFGDLDVSIDGKSLFVTNMADRKLYLLPLRDTALTVADAGSISSYAIPFEAICGTNHAVFGLGEYQGGVYVATACNKNAFSQRSFAVFRFDLATKQFATTPAMSFTRETVDEYSLGFSAISDIAFDAAGNMTLAFRHASADNSNGQGYAVVRRACVQDAVAHTWSLENNGSCGGVETAGKALGKGPGGGLFFYQEWSTDQGSAMRAASYGGVAQLPGALEAAYTVVDPFRTYEAGIAWLDLGLGDTATAGQRNRAYAFYRGTGSFSYPDNRPVNGKNGALGDLEILCDSPSIEIGNRVWQDTNSNGIQDAGETPIAGVKVELFAQGADVNTASPLATAVTDAEGYYVFSNDPRGYPSSGNNAPNDSSGANGGFDTADTQGGRASTASHKYGLSTLTANTHYQVVIRQVDGAGKQAALTTLSLTAPTQGTDEERNSDGGLVGTNAISNVTTLDAGNHYHAVDFGFVEPATKTDLELTKTANLPSVHRGDTVEYTLTLHNNSSVNATGVKVKDVLPSEVTHISDDASSQGTTYDKLSGVWDVGTVAAGTTKILKISVTVK